LVVLHASASCSNCLEINKIESLNSRKNLYYKISSEYETYAEDGVLESVLYERDLSLSDLEIDQDFESYTSFLKGDIDLKYNLEPDYIFNSDPSWKENININEINNQINTQEKTYTDLTSLKNIYDDHIITSKEVTFSNLLIDEGDAYFHSGEFSVKNDYYVRFESFNIIFISPENKMYPVRWIEDWDELLQVDDGAPFDDNTVDIIDGNYKINKWDNNTMINLFHPDMNSGEYLVVYELKLKGREVYIQSPVSSIEYRKI